MPTPQIFLRNISDLSELEGDENEIVSVEPTEEDRNVSDSYFRGLAGNRLYEALQERLQEEVRDFFFEESENAVILDEIKKRLERFDVLDATTRMIQAVKRY